MTRPGFTRLETRLVHHGYLVDLVEASVETPEGEVVTREIARHPGAVAIVALDSDDTVLLERQYRAALDADLLEIPAGKRDILGEEPLVTAQRELLEETGFEAASWSELGGFFNSPGFTDEHTTVFLARDLTHVGANLQGPEELAMELVRVPFESVWELIAEGGLLDAKSLIALSLAWRRLGR